MVREYIGARYVPKFMGTYDASQVYEALCVVDNGLGTSYISKIPTPAGTSLTDSTYWALYGASSGAIINLQDQINDINDKITTNEGMMTRKSPKDMHIVILGDSYADTDPTDYSYIIQDSGIFKQVDVIAGGGWGFTGKSGASGDTGWDLEWLKYFQNYVNGLTDEQKGDIDAVYIIGGFNDHYSSESVILTKMSTFFTWAHANLKTAYYLIECGWCIDHGNITTPNETISAEDLRDSLSSKVIKCYSQCADYGCTYLGTAIGAIHNYAADWDSSGYHPNTTGSAKLARAILSLILKGKIDIINDNNYVYVDGGNQSIGSITIIDDTLFFKGSSQRQFMYVQANASPNTDAVTDATIGTSGHYIASKKGYKNYIPIMLQIPDDTYYSTYMYINDDGTIVIVAPTTLTTSQRLRIRFMNASFYIGDC